MAESVEGTKSDWERENRWEDWILEEGRRRRSAKGIFFVYVWREREPLIHLTAWIWRRLWPRLVYTAGCFPEWAAQGRGTCSSLKHWSRGEPWMERCLVVPGKVHVLDLWNPQVEQSVAPKRKYLSLCFPLWTREEDTACNIRMKSKASVAQEDKSYDWSKSAGAGIYQHKQHKVYR